ncbi:MAG: YceI family protein [Bacteroidetes bacterium]|nr:YceI family protein [Bacteroidota bacterium]
MKKTVFLFAAAFSITAAHAQNMQMTKTGKISFYSRAKSIDKVEADNNEVLSMLNPQNGELAFSVLIKGFHFESALMEEHFNENYLESSKYPKSTFKGKITNLSTINFTKDGVYPATVDGELTIHGVTQKVSAPGSVTVKGGKIAASAKLQVKLKDYNISIPSLVADKISEDIDVTVDCKYEPKS